VTVPVAPAGNTLAVRVTGWPARDGLADELNVVEVETMFGLIVTLAVPELWA
jgi:hypothetical protein